MLVLYRPSNNKIIWYKSGPWLNQHDASFMKNGNILLFDNNIISAHFDRTGEREFFKPYITRNRILTYDFKNDSVYEIGSECHTEGLFTITGGSVVFDGRYIGFNFPNIGVLRICDTLENQTLNLRLNFAFVV